jgi:acyl carrier protein
VGRGYFNKPDLTAEKFVANPFVDGDRIYRTGDIGRWTLNGEIDFIGRKDDQVKIRGYRIELREIENCLQKYSDINSAAVIVRKSDSTNKELVAYFVSNQSIVVSELRTYLAKMLPGYMLPEFLIQLAELPLTANGKIDKKLLPDPKTISQSIASSYCAPRNEIEERLVAAWCEILDRERIGITDNFFDLGGHSLKAARMVNQIQREFNINIGINDIFINPTIEVLGQMIKAGQLVETTLPGISKDNRNILEV